MSPTLSSQWVSHFPLSAFLAACLWSISYLGLAAAGDAQSIIQLGAGIDGEAEGDRSGQAVSLTSDDQTVAIGAVLNEGSDNFSGHVRVYTWNGSVWGQRGEDIDGKAEGNLAGASVSLSGDGQTVAVGSPNGFMSSRPGSVRVFQIVSAAPDAPTITGVTAGDGEATIAFSPPGTGAVVTSYTVTTSPGGLTATCPASPCTVTGLINGQAYTFTVTGSNPVGTGPASAASDPVTPVEMPQTGLPVWLLYEATKD